MSIGKGLRAGICGKAVMENGKISSICDISSINIRIPHRIIGAGKYIYDFKGSLLTSEMFACTLCVVFICFVLEKVLSAAVRALAGKRGYSL